MSRSVISSRRRGLLAATLPAVLLVGTFLVLPFLMALWRSVTGAEGLSLQAYRALLDGAYPTAFVRTVMFAALVTFGCIVLGVPTTYLLLRAGPKRRQLLLLCISLPFFVGTLVRSYAWLALLGRHGLVNQALLWLGHEAPLQFAYRFETMLVASIQLELPLFILPLYAAMRHHDHRQALAAQSLGADAITAWFSTFAPAALAPIGACAALVFLTALGFFVTPALLGPADAYLLSQELEVRLNTIGDASGVAARVVVMLAIVALATGVALAMAQRRRRAAGLARRRVGVVRVMEALARRASPLRWWPVYVATALVLLLLLAPVLTVLPLGLSDGAYFGFPVPGFSWRWPATLLNDPRLRESALLSLAIATLAAALATTLGGAAALAAPALTPRWRRALTLVCCAPLVISSITMTAALFVLALHLPALDPIVLFVAVYAVLGLPFGFLLVNSARGQLPADLDRAAASLGASPVVTACTVTLPLLASAFAAAFVFTFVTAMDDVSAGLFLSTSERMPLALQLWDGLRYAVTPLPASAALLALGAGGTIHLAWRLWRRHRG